MWPGEPLSRHEWRTHGDRYSVAGPDKAGPVPSYTGTHSDDAARKSHAQSRRDDPCTVARTQPVQLIRDYMLKVMEKRVVGQLSPGRVFAWVLDMKHLIENSPRRTS